MKTAIFIGAGNVATHLSKAIKSSGIEIIQIYSRTIRSAQILANEIECEYTNNIQNLRLADYFFYCVKDDILKEIISQNPHKNGIHIHTAGSMDLSVFETIKQCGVLYPMQTFSKDKPVLFSEIPLFVEGNNKETQTQIQTIAQNISRHVTICNSKSRQALHLAAVFCCNFSNHLYALADNLLKENGLDFSLMLPLIKETTEKIQTISPKEAQTGPASRHDHSILFKHLLALKNDKKLTEIYTLLSNSIMDSTEK